jgi:RNA polymerase sigma-70 factor (ECF subfamily)
MTDALSPNLLSQAQAGDRAAFDRLFGTHLPTLRGVLRRMVGHPDDVDDLAQQTLLKAYEGLGAFRGESSAGTWLCSIGARLAIDHLRARKRWRERAQIIFAASCQESEELGTEVGAALYDPDFTFDVNEHIAYCFTCVGRTLEPEAQAALVLRDVLDLTNEEAASALGMNRSVLRHRLSEARDTMQASYDGLCALVNKEGACWQCSGLREVTPEGRRGPAVPARVDWAERLRIVREAALGPERSRRMHDVFFRRTEVQEQERRGDENATTDCGRPKDVG